MDNIDIDIENESSTSNAVWFSISVTDFPQQINAHAVAVGIYGCAYVSNVIEMNKINANYLVFQFVTLHYSAQLINARFFKQQHNTIVMWLEERKGLKSCYPADLLIVLFHIYFNGFFNCSSNSHKLKFILDHRISHSAHL